MEKTANKQKMHGGKIALYVIAILWTVVTLFPVVVKRPDQGVCRGTS